MWILEQIGEAIKNFLIDIIKGNLTGMFTDVNEKVSTIAGDVGQTPAGWNSDIFSMIEHISNTVIVPIAGLIITFVLVYELISAIMEKNNMGDFETFLFFKWVFKAAIAIVIVSNTFTIVSAVFEVGQHIVSQSASVIGSDASIDIDGVLDSMQVGLEAMGIGELVGLALETFVIKFCMFFISVVITIVIYGRMIEIFLYTSVAPIPFATFTNREWGQTGNNYLRGLIALAFQGLLIMVCVGIYAILVNTLTVTEDIHASIWMLAAYTVLLCFTLFKTGSMSKSIFNAH